MSSAKSQHLESHSIAQLEHSQQGDDEEEVFTDSRSQPSSPSQPSSAASTPEKKRPAALENGSNAATASIKEPSGRTLGERQSGADLQAPALQSNGSKQTETAMATVDPGDEEVLVKDLDTGRAVTVQKKYTIRDLTTGQLFVVDAEPPAPAAAQLEPGSPVTEGQGSGVVTDISSGKEMSLEEFDRALGLHTALEAARKHFGPGGIERAGSEGPAQPGSGKVLLSLANNKGASGWLKKHIFGSQNKSRLSSRSLSGIDSDDSIDTRGSPLSMVEGRRNDSGPASPSGRGQERQLRVHGHSKLVKEFTDLCLVQELNAHNGVVWTMKFSKNGKYLASAGQDAAVRVWEVCLNRGEAKAESESEQSVSEAGVEASKPSVSQASAEAECPVLQNTPHRTYVGHTADVLDLAWSKSQFLLTASMDKTVRLWHISMEDCLRVFKHTDFVTSLDFHPVDDKYFVSGSIDGKVRVWNIPEQRVVDWADVHEMVTATAFSPDGRRAVVGTMKGRCRFYQCEPTFKLEYQAQIDVKNRRGNTARGRKITGMQFLPQDPSQLLITSNDSRVRLYEGFNLRTKYKGHHNRNTQIRSTFSQDGTFLICGSDDGWVYIWTTGSGADDEKMPKQEKSSSYECFNAHNDIVTVALFAPGTARRTQKLPSRAMAQNAKGRINKLGLRQKFGKEDAGEALQAAEAVVKSERALGQVILSAGYNGEIKVFENFGCPHIVS